MLRILGLVVAVEAALETATLPTSIPRPSTKNVSNVFHNNTSPDNITITADGRSLLVDGRRWFPVDGELHFTRVPRFMWREELRRVKAGGLDQVATYVFWNHHEELRGDYDFSGRRDLRAFLETARDVGLKVLLRLGPWSHGEAKNGGHPDWVLGDDEPCGAKLRSELAGLFWRDGGPVWAVQLDNEIGDWKYLLGLREIALSYDIAPAAFTKTGWPNPDAGYPARYPMLPFFGGYADASWTNDMKDQIQANTFEFHKGPMMLLGEGPDPTCPGCYPLVPGFPWLDNPTTSSSYDYFAPLGEFGQPRGHYHGLKALHLMLRAWGDVLADAVPVPGGGDDGPTALRWAARASPAGTFLFVNNYQRGATLPPKTDVRFALERGDATLAVPSNDSAPLTIDANASFVWPVDVALPVGRIAWATAQLLTQTDGVVFLLETPGFSEVALDLGSAALETTAARTDEGGVAVLRGVKPSLAPFATIRENGREVSLVLLAAEYVDRVWTDEDASPRRVFVSSSGTLFVLPDGDRVDLRLDDGNARATLLVCPPPAGGTGVFGAVDEVDLPALDPPRPAVRLVKPFATPVRSIPVVKSSGKPREPDLDDWLGAAEYEINVTLPPGAEWRLRVDYAGDAARVLFEDRLLTDNWYTGYETSGGLEVGLSFLADENPGLLGGTTTLRLLVLPLQKKALEGNVFLDEKLWPAFDPRGRSRWS
ncbi:beta-galactosidase [Aureococcus anophagefferens]|nr:beta-galactosidase [Aureococcus anophagefferens]